MSFPPPEALAWYAYKVNQHSRTNIVNSDGTLLGFTYDYAYVQLGADIDLEGKPYGGLADESKATAADKYANVLKWIPIDQYYPALMVRVTPSIIFYMNSNAENQGLFGSARKTDTEVSFIRNTSIGKCELRARYKLCRCPRGQRWFAHHYQLHQCGRSCELR